MRYAICFATLFLAVEVVSCSSSDGSGGAATAEQACGEAATAYCSKVNSCAPFVISLAYGEMGTCTDAFKSICNASLKADNTGGTPAGYQKCAQDVAGAACGDVLSHKIPTSCQPSGGKIANGSACGDDWQCSSGYCALATNSACGVCADRVAAGGNCPTGDDNECAFGLVCAPSGQCVAPAAAGERCDNKKPCTTPNVCIGQTTTAQGTCGPSAAAGGACPTKTECDLYQGLVCNSTTSTCATIALSEAGSSCGPTATGFAVCKGAFGSCNVGTTGGTGTCPMLVAPGGSCSDTAPCKAGATCVNGRCTVHDPAACK